LSKSQISNKNGGFEPYKGFSFEMDSRSIATFGAQVEIEIARYMAIFGLSFPEEVAGQVFDQAF